VDLDAFANQLIGIGAGITDDTKTGKIWDVSAPTAIVCLLENNQVFAHELILHTSLSKNTLTRSFRNVFSGLTSDCYATELFWMFVLFVASGLTHLIPAVALNLLNEISILHVSSTSFSDGEADLRIIGL